MSKRREPQQERAIARKQRIIDATKLVLIELGYSKLTLRKIASAAGIGSRHHLRLLSNKICHCGNYPRSAS